MASDNKFFHNNFVDNTQHVYVAFSGYANHWDDGYPSGGNYWSDYLGMDLNSGPYQNETGRDGISEIVCTIDADNTDHYPLMTSYSPIYQGDFVLANNDVYAIEGRFDINGSIVVEENATLILKNAIVNFTQVSERQFNMTFRKPVNGNPRLQAYSSTITSGLDTLTYLEDNSTATINNSTICWYLIAGDYSVVSISNSSYVRYQYAYDYSVINVYDSTIVEWHNYNYGGGEVQVQVYDSEINSLLLGPRSVDCTISNLKPGHMSYWNSIGNCSLIILPGGATPNITLINTTTDEWRLAFYGFCNAEILNSVIGEVFAPDGSSVFLEATTCTYAQAYSSTKLSATDSFINYLRVTGDSSCWLPNSTNTNLKIEDIAMVYVCWYLNVHVTDSIGQNVPSANVSAFYPNATVAELESTDAIGWASLTLMEKMMNVTGSYPVGNYTVQATYETHSKNTTVSMTENKEIALSLDFVIPEFPSFLILPLLMIATLLAVIVYKREHII